MEQPPTAPGEEWVPSWNTGKEDEEDVALGSGPPPPPPPAAPEPAAPSRRRLHPLTLAVTGVVLAVGVASVAIAASFVLSVIRGGNLERMVPSDVDAVATVNLNPSAEQKVDLLRLSKKFPDLGSQKDLDQHLTDLLKPYGLDWKKDVQPWVGSELAVAGTTAAAKPDYVILVDARPDQQARAAAVLGILKSGPRGSSMIWRVSDHDGVKVNVGTEQGDTWVLTYFDHTVVIGSSERLVDEVIDTDHGKHGRITSDAEYQSITKRLPDDRLVTAYVSGKHLGDALKQQKARTPVAVPGVSGAPPLPSLDNPALTDSLAAYKAFAYSISARPDGLAADMEVDLDKSKLTAEQRRQLQQSRHGSVALGWMPAGAAGSLALANLDSTAKIAAAQLAKASPDAQQYMDENGITGPNGVLENLTGQFALEVSPRRGSLGAGAAIGTRDASGIVALLQKLKVLAPTTPGAPAFISYRGEQIHYSGGFAYATPDGYLLLGTTILEVERLVDAHLDHQALPGDSTYKSARAYVVSNPDTTLYVNVQSALKAAQTLAGPGSTLPAETKRWAAVKALMLTSRTDSDGTTSARFFLLIT